MDFKTYIKKLRDDAKITQEEAAASIGVGSSTIQNWERGTSRPELISLNSISKTYNTTVEEILKRLAKDMDILSNDFDEARNNYEVKYKEVLPSTLNYEPIDGFHFTKKEQELFVIMALNLHFYGNPVPELIRYSGDLLEVAIIIEKFIKYRLYTRVRYDGGEHLELSDKGDFVYSIIKRLDGKLFSVSALSFREYKHLAELYKVLKYGKDEYAVLRKLVSEENYDLDFYEDIYGGPKKFCCKSYIGRYVKYKGCYAEDDLMLIDKEYYTIEEIESKDEDYIAGKEAYLKKLEFYKTHKDLIDDLVEPKPFYKKSIRRAKPTEKAVNLIRMLDGEQN